MPCPESTSGLFLFFNKKEKKVKLTRNFLKAGPYHHYSIYGTWIDLIIIYCLLFIIYSSGWLWGWDVNKVWHSFYLNLSCSKNAAPKFCARDGALVWAHFSQTVSLLRKIASSDSPVPKQLNDKHLVWRGLCEDYKLMRISCLGMRP